VNKGLARLTYREPGQGEVVDVLVLPDGYVIELYPDQCSGACIGRHRKTRSPEAVVSALAREADDLREHGDVVFSTLK
jgi:hypothetical protein